MAVKQSIHPPVTFTLKGEQAVQHLLTVVFISRKPHMHVKTSFYIGSYKVLIYNNSLHNPFFHANLTQNVCDQTTDNRFIVLLLQLYTLVMLIFVYRTLVFEVKKKWIH